MDKFDKDYNDMTDSEKIEFFNEASDKTLLIMILDTLQRTLLHGQNTKG